MTKATRRLPIVHRDRYTAMRGVLRVLFLASLIFAPVFAIFPMLSGLLLPAVLVVILTGGLLTTIWWRQQRAVPATPAGQGVADVPASAPRWSRRAAAREGWRILSFLAVLSVVVAGALLDWRLLVMGSLAVFAAMALFGMPVWLAAAAQAAEDQAGLVGPDPRSSGDRLTGTRLAARVGGGESMKKAKDIMTRSPEFVRSAANLADAAGKMRDLDVGALPVCDEVGRFVGMITDRDITVRATANGSDPNRTTIADAMTRELFCCDEDDDITEVARVMQERQVRRVPIVRSKREGAPPTELAGIVSLGDLAVDLRVDEVPARTLAEVSEDSKRPR